MNSHASFELELVGGLSPAEQQELASLLAAARFGSLAVSWSELIRSVCPGKVSLFYLLIRKRARLIGLGVLYIVHGLDLGRFIYPRLGPITEGFARIGFRPLSFDIGFLEIPLMNLPGIVLLPEVEHARDIIRAQIATEFQGALGMDAMVIKSEPATMGPATAALGLLRMPALQNAKLALDGYGSYDSYLRQFSRNRRRSFSKARRRLIEHGAKLETLDRVDDCWPELYRLFRRSTRQAEVTGKLPLPFELGAAFYQRLSMLGPGKFQVSVVRYQKDIVAFILALIDDRVRIAKYFGADYVHSLATHAYFNLATHQIELAIAEGCTMLDCGTSSYAHKERLGCTLEPREYLVALYHPMLRPLACMVSKRFTDVEKHELDQRE